MRSYLLAALGTSALVVGSIVFVGCGGSDVAPPASDTTSTPAPSASSTAPKPAPTPAPTAVPGPPEKTFTLSATVVGLEGTGLVLRDASGAEVSVAPAGASQKVTFSGTAFVAGSAYAVTVKTQPSAPPQSCEVTGGTGTFASGDVDSVTVNCTKLFTVGGTVTGLAGAGLVLENNGSADSVAVNANGTFAFPKPLATGAAYAVTVKTSPTGPKQDCVVGSASGNVASANVTDVTVDCTTQKHTLSVAVTGMTGTGLVFQNKGADDLAVAADGTFAFATQVANGAPYDVAVYTQPSNPWQTCTLTSPKGTMGDTDVVLQASCVVKQLTVKVALSGLTTNDGLVLQNNGGDDLTLNANQNGGVYGFATTVPSGGTYAVTVKTQPSGAGVEQCAVSGPSSGTVFGIDPTVTVKCGPFEPRTHEVQYNGYAYATLDDADPAAPINFSVNYCQTTPIALPFGWQRAPEDPNVVTNVIAPYYWATHCLLFADGVSYGGKSYNNGGACGCSGSQCVTESPANTFVVTSCARRILIRRPL